MPRILVFMCLMLPLVAVQAASYSDKYLVSGQALPSGQGEQSPIEGNYRALEGQDLAPVPNQTYSNQAFGVVTQHANDVPLGLAVEQIMGADGCFKALIDPAVNDVSVSYGGGEPWPDTLRRLGDYNGLFVVFNYQDCLIGVSRNKHVAKEMALTGGTVWRLLKGHTLKQNLQWWAERAGWSLAWDNTSVGDLMIDHEVTLVGHFHSEDMTFNVLEKVLSGTRKTDYPLMPVYKSNRVVVIADRLPFSGL